MLFLALLFFLLAIVFFLRSERQRKASGLPSARVIYSDTSQWRALEKPLYDAALGLVGRPDYLVEKDGMVIPVEVKSRPAPLAPYESHLFQLMAYCLLVERIYGRRPAYGILHYSDVDFAVEYTPERENAILNLLAEMQRDRLRTFVARSHEDAARCVRCGFRSICDQRLA
ncbi:MAG: PD-(D/E)XK nuclease family protein [Anaerolineales bacterium]